MTAIQTDVYFHWKKHVKGIIRRELGANTLWQSIMEKEANKLQVLGEAVVNIPRVNIRNK